MGSDGRASSDRGRLRSGTSRLAYVLLLVLLAIPETARAESELEQGKRLAIDLEFEPALAALERAISGPALTRADMIELLSERALLLFALERRGELVKNFLWLSALAPEHRLDLRAPPALTALWTSVRDQSRGPLGLDLEASATATELAARASLTGTVPEGARARIVLRRPGEAWRCVEGGELHERAAPGDAFELYAEAVGIGGVVFAQRHTARAPLQLTARASSAQETVARAAVVRAAADRAAADRAASEREVHPSAPATPHSEQPDPWRRRHRTWLLGGSAALLVASVVVASLLTRPEGADGRSTDLMPMVRF